MIEYFLLEIDYLRNFFNHKKTIKKYSIDNIQFPLYDNAILSEIGGKIFLLS